MHIQLKQSFNRISAMFLRYLYLHKRSVSRTLEIVFWPVMELFVWGFLTVYLRSLTQGPLEKIIIFLIGAMIFWDLLYRSQQGVSLSIVEEMWTQNITNIFVSPLRISEWLLATFFYSMAKILLIASLLSAIAFFLYHFNFIGVIGFYLIPLSLNLFLFGWAMGIFTSSLLIRWGHSVEALIWGVPFLLQPFSAIFYPLSILPLWIQKVAVFLPSTHVFEGMREIVRDGKLTHPYLLHAFLLNGLYFLAVALFFNWMLSQSRKQGKLGRLGSD